MSDIIVFLGPTLDRVTAAAKLSATFLPPARQGDVYRACYAEPRAIAVIDGYFDRVPAVWHKEILWALSKGIHVFGSSSMGALRAAELSEFGMIGVGRIFERFSSGEYQDDDEVAIAHAESDSGYRPASEAMVNIRATLERALLEEVISPDMATRLCALAKARFYPERSFPGLLQDAEHAGFSCELDAFRAWWRAGRVDQKRLDALELLDTLCKYDLERPHSPSFALEPTDAWSELRRRTVVLRSHRGPHQRFAYDFLVDELLIAGEWASVHAAAMNRVLSISLSNGRGQLFRPGEDEVQAAAEGFRRERGLFSAQSFEQWIQEQRLSDEDLTTFFEDEARVRRSELLHADEIAEQVVAHLRATGQYGALARRIDRKLALFGADQPKWPRDVGHDEAALWQWFFVSRLGGVIPTDLAVHVWMTYGATVERLLQAIVREYWFATRGARCGATPEAAVCDRLEA